jgi:hypothetical protein
MGNDNSYYKISFYELSPGTKLPVSAGAVKVRVSELTCDPT